MGFRDCGNRRLCELEQLLALSRHVYSQNHATQIYNHNPSYRSTFCQSEQVPSLCPERASRVNPLLFLR
jgi:hypothetical protein